MMGKKIRSFAPLPLDVSLEELVPKDHFYRRLEARLDPHNRAVWAVAARRGAQRIRELRQAGQWQPPLIRHPELAERQRQRMRRLAADPVYRAALIRQLSRGAREATEFVERTCVVCGTSFQAFAARVRAGEGKTCSPDCSRARRAQVLREHQPARTAPDAWRQRTRLQARAQWRQSPRYHRLAVAVRRLEPAALASLPPRDRQMLGWYYGLETAGELLDHTQIGERLGLSPKRVARRLHRTLAHLLGSGVVHAAGDRGGTTAARCGVCRGLRQQPSPIGPVLSWQERERVLALQVALGAVTRCARCGQLRPIADTAAGRHRCRPPTRRPPRPGS